MGKTRDLFKKIRDTKGNFHAKMGKIKERKESLLKRTMHRNRGKQYNGKD